MRENAPSARLYFKLSGNWSNYVRVFHDQARSLDPQDVSGRFFKISINPTNAIYNLQGILGNGSVNEFKFGYNGAPSNEGAQTQAGFENIAISLQGTVANAGIAGQGASNSFARGGLVRVNSAGNGRGLPDPYSLDLRRHLQQDRGASSRRASTRARFA